MSRVIASVKLESAAYARELELPASVRADVLIPRVVEILGGGRPTFEQCSVTCFPAGHTLQAAETLAVAGVWDGAWILIGQRWERNRSATAVQSLSKESSAARCCRTTAPRGAISA